MSLIAIIAVPILIIASLVLVFSCLHIRRIVKRKQSRCKTKKDEENGKSDNRTGTTVGEINAACEDATGTAGGIYETCDQDNNLDIYDYAIVRLGKSNLSEEPKLELPSNTADDVYAVLEETSQEDVEISENVVRPEDVGPVSPIYFTLERNSRKTTSGNVPIGSEEIRSGSQENEGYMDDNEVPSGQAITSDPVYFTLENNSSDVTNELVSGSGGICQESRKSEGYTENVAKKDNVISEPVYFTLETNSKETHDVEQEKYGVEEQTEGTVEEIYENASAYIIQKDDTMSSTERDGAEQCIKDDDGKDSSGKVVFNGKQRDSTTMEIAMEIVPDEEIYEDWTNETIARKVKSSSRVTNQYVKCGHEKQYRNNVKCDIEAITDVNATSSDIYQNIEEVRNSLYWQEAM